MSVVAMDSQLVALGEISAESLMMSGTPYNHNCCTALEKVPSFYSSAHPVLQVAECVLLKDAHHLVFSLAVHISWS